MGVVLRRGDPLQGSLLTSCESLGILGMPRHLLDLAWGATVASAAVQWDRCSGGCPCLSRVSPLLRLRT